jgi:solute carrier family 25 protein 38
VFIAAYEATKRVLAEPGQRYPVLLHTVPATAAAIVATLVTAPFDLIKTDLQLRQSNNPPSIRSSLHLILNGRFANSHVLFKGSGLRLLRKCLSSAIGWTL